MIKKSTPQTASASVTGDTQIETLLVQLAGVRSEMFNSLDEIANRFYKFAEVMQVKNEELVKNPFKAEMWAGFGQSANAKFADLNSKIESVKQTSESERHTGHLQLLSIMASDARKCCMIDDKILYEGDSIKGFKVQMIGDDFVRLGQTSPNEPNSTKPNTGAEIILKLSE